MKTYKDFPSVWIGDSDIAALLLRPCYGNPTELKFGGDGSYRAYLVTEAASIGAHYTQVLTTNAWLWIYDDNERTFVIYAPEITVYRAGDRGCIIYAPGGKLG